MAKRSQALTGKHVLLLPESYAEAVAPAARAIAPGLEILCCRGHDLPAGAQAAEIYLHAWGEGTAALLDRLLEEAPGLRWVHTPSAGINHLPLARMFERGILLTKGTGIHSVPIAESVMAYLLANAKRVREHFQNQQKRRYEQLPLDELAGRSLLLFGYGSIGREIAARARAFGMRICAVRRGGAEEAGLDHVWGPQQLAEAVEGADAVVAAAPLTDETRGVFDARVFAAMKEGCHFINIARGELVVEKDLIEGLRRGHPAVASLDVFEREPLSPDSPLWALPSVVITPHDSWRSPGTKSRAAKLFLDNLACYLAGRPLRNRVDYRLGY